jgi:hypothetical protein
MRKILLASIALIVLLATTAAPVLADGGPVIRQRDVWEALEEGQQIAVVALDTDGTVHTNLFISLIDHTGVSHEITFFLPLGRDASEFGVAEEDSSSFEKSLTAPLDEQLKQVVLQEHNVGQNLRWSLLAGSWVINGGWSWPLVALFALSACAADVPQPVEIFHTDSSRVSIYGIDEDTDVVVLISTTGLDPSVQEALRAFGGQQIAVVSMRTRPPPGGDTSSYYRREAESQSGLHLRWTSRAVERADGGWEHSYPLGTGGAWARPIPLTRVYVTAPLGVGFRVEYPVYGADLSAAYIRSWYSRSAQVSVYQARDETAYAVDHRITSQGHLWRGVYTQANPAQDLYIIHDATAVNAARGEASRYRWGTWIDNWSWLLSVVVALAAWVICWRLVMPSRLGRTYRWRDAAFWRDALAYPLANGLILGVLYALVTSLARLGNLLAALLIAAIAVVAVVLALPVSSLLFARRYENRKGEATKGYWIVVALANASHLILGAIYALVLGNLSG